MILVERWQSAAARLLVAYQNTKCALKEIMIAKKRSVPYRSVGSVDSVMSRGWWIDLYGGVFSGKLLPSHVMSHPYETLHVIWEN